MNRRSFIDRIAKAALAFSVLPSATTYARTWKAHDGRRDLVYVVSMNPSWETAQYETVFLYQFRPRDFSGKWNCAGDVGRPPLRWKKNEQGVFTQVERTMLT